MSKTKTHYEVLKVAPTASRQTIQASYRRLAQKHHPDRNAENKEQATELMKAINGAWAVLSDATQRSKYDAQLQREEADRIARQKAAEARAAKAAEEEAQGPTKRPASGADTTQATPDPRTPPQQPQPSNKSAPPSSPPPVRRSWKPHFLHVVAGCAGIAWLYAARLANSLWQDGSGLSMSTGLLNRGVFDLAGTPFVMGLFFACVGWIAGKVLPKTRKNSSWCALVAVLAFYVFLWQALPPDELKIAQKAPSVTPTVARHRHSSHKKPPASLAHASSKEPNRPQTSAPLSPDKQHLYDQTIDELERNYPEVNPREARFQPRLAKKILERKAQLEEEGMAPHVAIRAATTEILDAVRHSDETVSATQQ